MKKTENIIHTLLQELSLSRPQLANNIGVSVQAISNWCSRDSLPKKAKIYFHDKHNVNYVYLEKGEGPIFKKDIEPINQDKIRYLEHLEKENAFLRDLVKSLTDFNKLLDK